ncbi:Tubulin epsilon chain, partial [Physocladia obscura]
AERCDSLQSFFQINSLGGGTGSGLGSRVLEILADSYPRVYRFATVVSPSPTSDDVITSPYNTLLSLAKLVAHADCILPIDNQALADICRRSVDIGGGGGVKKSASGFDDMNNIVANLISNLTSSMRFEGSMNIDINDIVTNLVPFPRRKFLLSSMTPLVTTSSSVMSGRLDQMFTDAFSKDYQLLKVDPKSSTYLACALMIRGQGVEISDVRRNIDRAKSWLKFAHWNQE